MGVLKSEQKGLVEGDVVFLSGCNTGMGREAALLFAGEGADLVISARKSEIIDSIAEEVRALGRRCLPVVCDIANAEDCLRAADAAIKEFGKIDTLINIAYRSAYPDALMPLVDTSPDIAEWRACFEVNVFGTMQMTRAVARHMIERKSGRILMIGTMTSEKQYAGSEAYTGSKIAMTRMARSVAMELGPHGIRVNTMHPGPIWGPRTQFMVSEWSRQKGVTYEEEQARLERENIMRYIPSAAEHAKVMLFFASHLSDAIAGQSLHVNGGAYLY